VQQILRLGFVAVGFGISFCFHSMLEVYRCQRTVLEPTQAGYLFEISKRHSLGVTAGEWFPAHY
jgi:hypothetical protein